LNLAVNYYLNKYGIRSYVNPVNPTDTAKLED